MIRTSNMESYASFFGVLGELEKIGYSANSSTDHKSIFIFKLIFMWVYLIFNVVLVSAT